MKYIISRSCNVPMYLTIWIHIFHVHHPYIFSNGKIKIYIEIYCISFVVIVDYNNIKNVNVSIIMFKLRKQWPSEVIGFQFHCSSSLVILDWGALKFNRWGQLPFLVGKSLWDRFSRAAKAYIYISYTLQFVAQWDLQN